MSLPLQRPVLLALLGGLAGALMALLTLAPAFWLSQAIGFLSHQQVLLQHPEGTLWRGSAQLALSAGPNSQLALGLPSRLHWQVKPWALSFSAASNELGPNESGFFTLALELQAPCCLEHPLLITIKPEGLGLLVTPQRGQIKLPAHWLEGLGAPWNTLQPKGLLTLENHNFQVLLQKNLVSPRGTLELKIDQLSSRLSTVKPLGSYSVILNSQSSPQIELSSQANSRLRLSGKGQWGQGRLHFEGLAETAPSDEDTLSNLLNVLGQRSGHQAQLRID
jgi:general secretion pathway protein N